MNGTITDPTGAVIAGARITAMNTATSVSYHTVTNGTGYYELPSLLPGEYVVSASAPGFDSTKSSPFTIATGQGARIDLALKAGSSTITVEVSSAATLINTTNNELGVTIDSTQIENLPINERNVFELIALQPGVNVGGSDDPSTATGQTGRGGFEVNGAPGLGNAILLDGVDATFGDVNGIGTNGSGTSASVINVVGVGGIEEFRTSSSVPPAEFGRSVGGTLTITTKSGGNKLHGEIFEYFRNDIMDADAWDNKHVNPIVPVPELRFNEFGGYVDGPILRRRLFFFLNYEGTRGVIGASSGQQYVPTTHELSLIKNPDILKEFSWMPTQNVTPNCSTSLYIQCWVGNLNTNTIEDTGMVRVDYDLKRHHLMSRFNMNNQSQAVQQRRLNNQFLFPLRFYNGVVSDAWTISESNVNEFRIGLDRNDLDRNYSTYYSDPYKNYISMNGGLVSDVQQQILYFLNTSYTLADNFTSIRGRHTLNFGTDDRLLRSVRYEDENTHSYYTGTSTLNVAADAAYQILVEFPTELHYNPLQLAFYAQDSYRASSGLTLNLGVRYEKYSTPNGGYNIIGSDPFGPLNSNRTAPLFTEGKSDFAPRVGFVSDLYGDRKLVFRAGFGMMFLPPQPLFVYSGAMYLDPRLPVTATLTPSDMPTNCATVVPVIDCTLHFPVGDTIKTYYSANPDQIPAGLELGRSVSDHNHKDQYSINWNANLQHQLTSDLMYSLTYTALRVEHSPTWTAPNQFAPGACPTTTTCGARPDPNLGAVNYIFFPGREYYNGLYAAVRYKHAENRVDLYYTYASSIDFWAAGNNVGNGNDDVQDFDHPELSRGPSVGASRNKIATSYTFTNGAPGFAMSNRLLRGALGNYSLQGIIHYNSGVAANVYTDSDLVRNDRLTSNRPDRVPGTSMYLKTTLANGNKQWLNPAAFDGTTPYNAKRYGNLGYNAVVGAPQINFNASLIKSFQIYRMEILRLRFEAFNVFNHPNMDKPEMDLSAPTFGQVIGRGKPRNVQLGAEFRF